MSFFDWVDGAPSSTGSMRSDEGSTQEKIFNEAVQWDWSQQEIDGGFDPDSGWSTTEKLIGWENPISTRDLKVLGVMPPRPDDIPYHLEKPIGHDDLGEINPSSN